MKTQLLVTTLFSLIASITIFYATNKLHGVVAGHEMVAGVVIAVAVAMISFCLYVLWTEFRRELAFLIIAGFVTGLVYFSDPSEPLKFSWRKAEKVGHHAIN